MQKQSIDTKCKLKTSNLKKKLNALLPGDPNQYSHTFEYTNKVKGHVFKVTTVRNSRA